MKQKWILITLVIFALTACTSPDHEAMRQRLKYVSDCNRADTVFTERWLPTVDSLVAYFDRHGSANERMMAHYVQGRVHHDMGEAPQALECYQKAAEQADTTSSDCDLYTLYAVYGQIAKLFHLQYLPDDEMQALKTAERIAWKDKDTLSALKAYELEGRPYFLKGEKDSMFALMSKARELFLKAGYQREATEAIFPAIAISLDSRKLKEANTYLCIYENEILNRITTEELLNNGYYDVDKGRYLLAVGNIDSAQFYFRQAVVNGQKEAGYQGLLSVFEQKNTSDSIAKYAKLFAAANDSSYLRVNQQQVEQVRAMYNFNRQKQIAEQTTTKLQKANRDKVVMAMAMILLLTAAIIIGRKLRHRNEKKYILLAKEFEEKQRLLAEAIDRQRLLNYDFERNMREKELERQEMLQRIQASQSILSAVVEDKIRLQQTLEDLHTEQEFLMQQHQEMMQEKNQEIETLELNVQKLESKLQQYASVDMEAAFKRTAIYKFFEKRRNPRYSHDLPKEKDWDELIAFFRTHFVRYYSFIAISHRLPVNQFRYCILLRLGFDGSDIGVLMDKDRDQRHNLRRFIYEELFGKPVQVRLLEEKLKQFY